MLTKTTSNDLKFSFEFRYQYDTDKTLTQIRFVSENNEVIGAINWFAVHPTSMNNTNHFVSTDNVGYAAILLEQQMNKNNLPGRVCKRQCGRDSYFHRFIN